MMELSKNVGNIAINITQFLLSENIHLHNLGT